MENKLIALSGCIATA